MPLVLNTLVNNLREIFDEEYSGFSGFPADINEAAQKWSEAIGDYAQSIVPPTTTISQAKSAMNSVISGITNNGVAQLPISFTNFAASLAIGMQPAFTGTPPSVPVDFSSIYPIGLGGGSSEQVINAMAAIIDAWFRTGIAVNNTSGVSVPWS